MNLVGFLSKGSCGLFDKGRECSLLRILLSNFFYLEVFIMNDFGLVQLIWIKRLVSETTRINVLIECNRLSKKDLNRYKSVISAIDDFCAFVINSQNWRDVENISRIVDEVEMVLFQHFYEQIDAFEDEEVHLDLSGDGVNLNFENPFIENQSFDVIDDESYMNIGSPVVEGEILELPDQIELEIDNEDSFLALFDMKPGESREISVEDFIKILSQNQDELSFNLNPYAFYDEEDISSEDDILSEDVEVSFEEFIAHLIDCNSSRAMGFGLIDDNDDLIN